MVQFAEFPLKLCTVRILYNMCVRVASICERFALLYIVNQTMNIYIKFKINSQNENHKKPENTLIFT